MYLLLRLSLLIGVAGILLAASCNHNNIPCVNNYILEVPVQASFQDTMSIGDTIVVTMTVPDSLEDVNSGKLLDLTPTAIDNRFEITFGRLDTNVIDIAAERFFTWIDHVGEVTEWEQSQFTRLFLKFEDVGNQRIGEIGFIPQHRGVFFCLVYDDH